MDDKKTHKKKTVAYTALDEALRERCRVHCRENRVRWREKSKEVKKANSRDGACERTPDGLWRKFCENCGEEFLCISESRHLCQKCHWTKVYGGGYPEMVFGNAGGRGCGGYVERYHAGDYKGSVQISHVTCPRCGSDAVRKDYKFQEAKSGAAVKKVRHGLHYYLQCEHCGLITDWQPVVETGGTK